jgi:hypothetical protein
MSLSSINRRIEELTRQMAEAVDAEDFERAARLRDELSVLKGEATAGNATGRNASPLVRQPPPGQMGLGTNVPVAAPPKGWTRPRKPDPMTRGHKGRGR